MKNILIFGGFGFIGSNIIEKLLGSNDYKIFVFEHAGMVSVLPNLGNVKVYYGDFYNEKDVEVAFKGNDINIVLHLISTTVPANSNDNVEYDINANLVGTIRLLDIMVKYHVDKLVFLSSGGTIYGISNNDLINEDHRTYPISSHGIMKLAIEKYIYLYNHLYNLDFLILRPGNPYGKYHRSQKQGIINVFLRQILNNEKIVIKGDGSNIRDYIYIDDFCEILYQLLEKDVRNEIINIGTGIGYSINQLVEFIRNFHNNFDIEYVPSTNYDVPKVVLDIAKMNSFIKFNFTDIELGIRKTYDYLVKTKKF